MAKRMRQNIVKVCTPDDTILVYVRSDKDHKLKMFSWHRWDSYHYNGYGDKKVSGSFIQLPFRLGYAITIHKSQGQTFSRCNLSPKIFADGQLYVALSRVTDIKNLYLTFPINESMVRASDEVAMFYQWLDDVINPIKVKFADIKTDRVKLISWLNNISDDQFAVVQSLLRNALQLKK